MGFSDTVRGFSPGELVRKFSDEDSGPCHFAFYSFQITFFFSPFFF